MGDNTSQVVSILDRYLAQLARGAAPAKEVLLAQHPELADGLEACLSGLQWLRAAGQEHAATAMSQSADDGSSLAAGRLGDFRLLREIGRGGMGVVYEAEQCSLGRRVAIKVLPFAGLLDGRQRQRFLNEAHAAARLNHPNIIDVIAVGCERGVHFYAMRLVEGPTLAEVIAELSSKGSSDAKHGRGPSPLARSVSEEGSDGNASKDQCKLQNAKRTSQNDAGGVQAVMAPVVSRRANEKESGSAANESDYELPHSKNPESKIENPKSTVAGLSTESPREYGRAVARLMVDIAQAVDYAHQVGVIHRDIKPSNILLDSRGKPWVTDFGLARLETDAELTMTGDLLGTLRYMSPEQLNGQRGAVDHRADVYSLGATLYELLTLRPAFPALDRAELLRRIPVEPPRPPRKINRSLSAELETIALKALEKSPADRYATAGEMADDLARFLEHRPIRARRSRLAAHAKSLWRRHQVLFVAVLSTLLFASCVAGVFVWRQWQRTVEEHGLVLERDASLRDRVYAGDMRAAHQAWQRGDVNQARQILDRYANADAADLRGFEWHYLSELLAARSDPLQILKPDGKHVYCVQFSPDGTLLVTCTGGCAQLWSTADWSLVRTFDGRGAGTAVFSPDGQTLVTDGDHHTLRFWNVASGDLIRTLDSGLKEVLALAISPDGQMLASGGVDYNARLWSMSDGALRGEFKASNGRVQSLAFSPNGAELAVGGGDFGLRIWDVATLTMKTDAENMGTSNYSVAYSPDGAVFASGNGHGLIGIYNPSGGSLDAVLGQHRRAIRGIAISPSGKLLASGDTEGVVELWDVANRSLWARFAGHADRVWSVAFSHDGRRLASGSDDGTVRIWDTEAEPALKRANLDPLLYSVHFSADGKQLLIGTHFCDLVTCDAATLNPLLKRPTRGTLLRVAIDPTQRLLAASSDLGEVFVGEPFSGPISLFEPAKGRTMHGVALGKDARLVLSLADGTLEVWEPQTKVLLDRREVGKSAGAALAVSANGQLVAIPCGNLLIVYDVQRLAPCFQHTADGFDCHSVAFSPDGRVLCVGLQKGPILFLDPRSGTQLASLTGHQLGAKALAFTSDGRTLASIGADSTLRLWHVPTRQELFTLHQSDRAVLWSLAFSPDGRQLVAVTATYDGHGEVISWQGVLKSP